VIYQGDEQAEVKRIGPSKTIFKRINNFGQFISAAVKQVSPQGFVNFRHFG